MKTKLPPKKIEYLEILNEHFVVTKPSLVDRIISQGWYDEIDKRLINEMVRIYNEHQKLKVRYT